MDVRPIDPADDEGLRAAYELTRRALLLGREGTPFWSWQEFAGTVRKPDPGERHLHLGGWDGDRLIAVGSVFLPVLDNREKAWVEVAVDPVAQRRGHGSALLEDLVERARAEGRTLLVTDAKLPFDERETHGYRRFAERHGFTYANAEVVRHLALPVPSERLDEWTASAAERAEGYSIETYVDDELPADLVPSLCVLLGQLAVDAPTGAVDWEEEAITPERFAEQRASLEAQGRTMFETLAVTRDRVVAAQSTLAVPADRTDVSQWGTFVHRAHRGHRLGLATKVANLRAVQRAHPRMRRVVTQNAETNDHMVSINVLMGFEPVEVATEFFRRL